jgi:hypothetical protein
MNKNEKIDEMIARCLRFIEAICSVLSSFTCAWSLCGPEGGERDLGQ